jgi:predicted porin
VKDDNGGKQVSGRVAVTPAVGLIIGASAGRGAWLARTVAPDSSPTQQSFGADVEYSRDHWIIRSEAVWSRWAFPAALAPSNTRALDALGSWVEGRYRVTPRIFLAARADHLGFSDLRGSILVLPWDSPVKRIESGFGYYLQRNLVFRATAQQNWRDAGRVKHRTYISGQLAYWF